MSFGVDLISVIVRGSLVKYVDIAAFNMDFSLRCVSGVFRSVGGSGMRPFFLGEVVINIEK